MNSTLAHRIWTALVVVVSIVIVAYIVTRIPRTIAIFVLASIIALGVYPVTSRLERYMHRALAIAVVFGILGARTVLMAFLIAPATFSQIQALIVNSPDYTTLFRNWVSHFETGLRLR